LILFNRKPWIPSFEGMSILFFIHTYWIPAGVYSALDAGRE
jgi:hypothetical protein